MKSAVKSKETLAVLFGGRSAEHEISVITALQAINALDRLRYEVVPVYIAPDGRWYTGDPLLDKGFYRRFSRGQREVTRVTLLPDPTVRGLVPVDDKGRFQLADVIPIDVYFLAFHGQYGEDGCIQGLLELANAAYTGCDVTASAVAMDKYQCKAFLKAHGIPVLPSALIPKEEAARGLSDVYKRIHATPGLQEFPLFVKPCHLGSSIGVSVARDEVTLGVGLAKAFRYDDRALVEPCVTQLLEINVAVLGGQPLTASVVEIPMASKQVLTYEDKYLRGGDKSGGRRAEGMASLTRIIDPKDLDVSVKSKVIDYALEAFRLLDCAGVGRFDFMMDTSSGALYFNELNPIPGSLAYYLWEKSTPQLLYTEVLQRMVQEAVRRRAEKRFLQRDTGFRALKP